MENFLPISEYISILRRHFLGILAVVICGMAFSAWYAIRLPKTYQAFSVVQIVHPLIQSASSQAESNSVIMQRLQVVEQQLMARTNIENLIRQHNLYSGITDLSPVGKVNRLRENIEIERIQDPALQWRIDILPSSLIVRVMDEDANVSALIANELTQQIVLFDAETSASQAEGALDFFDRERKRIGASIRNLDTEIADFKQENVVVMGHGLEVLRNQLSNLDEDAFLIERKITSLRSEMGAIGITAQARKLDRQEEQLVLINTKREAIASQILRGPQVERRFGALTRKLEQLSEQYRSVTREYARAEMEHALQGNQHQTNFSLLERAAIPEYPISPNRKKIGAFGGVISLIVALVFVMIIELRNPVMRSSVLLQHKTGLQPVLTIPTLTAPDTSVTNSDASRR